MTWQPDMARKADKDAETAVARLCITRDDGRWDYYPDGFAKPGFVIDADLRAKVIASRTKLFRVLMPVWVGALGLGVKGGELFSDGSLAPYAASGVIRWCVVSLLGLAMMVVWIWLIFRRQRAVLRAAPPASKVFDPVEARQMRYGGREPTTGAKRKFAVVLLTLLIGGSVACAWFAWQHLGRNGSISMVEAMLLAIWSVLLAAFPMLCAVGQIRARLLASNRGR